MKELILNELASVQRSGIPKLLEQLRHSDFFKAPASTKHHLAVEGGLATHSWNVYQCLADLNQRHDLGIPHESIIIAGLLHDLCKVGLYRREMKRVRSPEGNWSDQEVWGYKDELPLGHGEKSVMVAMDYITLTADEKMAIRWHMGPWDADGYSAKRNLGEAMDKCMLLKMLMLADQTATWIKER